MVPLKMPSSTTSLTLEEQTFLSSSVRERAKKAQTESLLNTLTLNPSLNREYHCMLSKLIKAKAHFDYGSAV